ncbi:hypothetical protein LTR37_009584 [Vermiconidia calcicola]|uniref:Uncharacterized protein n=1 Tax=Vermiconidia calcicola TaxID=1690605 RepID=A0ACC3N7K7_9PEZI|nr:hypothetical protein LTR37_009584 [Vermiconidia calcicola]
MACRNIEKGNAAMEEIRSSTSCPPETLEVWHLDMSSYASVQSFAEKANSTLHRIDAVVANAGIAAFDFRLVEGNEETITCNVVSTILLGLLLQPKLRETAKLHKTQAHFTITGSDLYAMAKFKESQGPPGRVLSNLNDKAKSDLADRYNVSKLLVVLMVRQMAAMSPLESNDVIMNTVGPGARKTEVGARVLVHGAGAGADSHGKYLPDGKVRTLGALAKGRKGTELQELVWKELKDKLEDIRPGIMSP